MAYNKILSKKTIASIMKSGQEMTVSVATRTSTWMRPDVAANAIAEPFTKAVESFDGQLPADTKDICARSFICILRFDTKD